MKKLIALLACLSLSLHITGCTSSDTKEDSEEISAEEGATDEAALDGELESVESADAEEAPVDTANEGFLDEQLPEDALGESTATAESAPPPEMEEPAAPVEPGTDSFAADATTEDSGGTPDGFSAPPPVDDTSSSVAGVDPGAESTMDAPAPSEPTTDTASSSSSSYAEEAPAPVVASLKKIDTAPRTVAGQLLNAVYVARPKDTWKSISTMVYGSADKANDIKAANSWIKGQPKGGDKVYYNSPQRPTDDTRVLTYYEDNGMVPDVYVAKDGDNLRSISKDLLGYDNAWKEVWATNAVDSKSELAAGTELRYWKSAPMAAAPMTPPPAQDMAMNQPPPQEIDMLITLSVFSLPLP